MSEARPAPAWLETARGWPLVTESAFPSQHFGRAHLAEIRVSPMAENAYRALTPDTPIPEGSFFVEWLRDARTSRQTAVFALERSAEGWRFWVLDARGRTQRSGALEPCLGCHAGAPSAPVFGLPRARESTANSPRSL